MRAASKKRGVWSCVAIKRGRSGEFSVFTTTSHVEGNFFSQSRLILCCHNTFCSGESTCVMALSDTRNYVLAVENSKQEAAEIAKCAAHSQFAKAIYRKCTDTDRKRTRKSSYHFD